MKPIPVLLLCVAAITAWCPPSFAARQTAVGPGTIPLDADGVLSGVDMSVSGITGTLSVGVPGGPQMDIFTSNNPLGTVSGLAVSTAASSQGNIVFNSSSTVYGNIGVTQPGGPFLLNIDAGAAGTAVNFLGSVFATTLNVTGTGAVNFNSGSTNYAATNFAGDGTIRLAPNTTVIGALITATANTGTLALGGGSVLDGAVGGATGLRAINVMGGDNIAGVSASITGAVDAYSFSLGTNTLNIGGALTIPDAGVINTTLASPTLYGKIIPTGATNTGPTLGVNVTVPSTAYIPVGTKFNIVDGTNGPGGSVATVTVKDPTNPLYTFSPDPLAATAADGKVTIKTDTIPLLVPIVPPPDVVLPPVTPMAVPVVPVLVVLPVTPDVVEVLTSINALSDPVAVVDAVAQLAPSTPALAAPLVRFQGSRQFQNLWSSRLDMCRQEVNQPPDPNCRGNKPRSGWWVKGFGYFGNQDARGAFTGYDSRVFGTMVAYDAPLGLDTRAGLGFGYARSMIAGEMFDASTDFDTYQATAYIGHECGPWFVNGSASLGWNEYSSMRHIVFPGVDRTANAKYSGQDYTAFASTGYHFSAQKFTITPLASLQYTRMHLGDCTETGAGDIGLKMKSQDYDFLESGLGVSVERYLSYRGGTYVPEVHFNWFHELSNPALARTAEFTVPGSPSFTTPGLKTADDTFNVGGGLTLLSCVCSATTWSLEAVYDYDWTNEGYSANQVMMRFTKRF
jgi:outer membrane autotransporter protein